ncbi:MAG: NADH-quinone oxidoreductase subunit K [Candidatus Margulisbacteria bacterium]|nr:NADH-quinone oxidoreductase subunit K [Candidatus Margulisiibacteriota bacterium]
MMTFFVAALLLSIGLYCVAVKRDLIKIAIGIIIMEYAITLFFVASAPWRGGEDYLAQVAALTGLATTIVIVALVRRLYGRYGTLDISQMRRLKG